MLLSRRMHEEPRRSLAVGMGWLCDPSPPTQPHSPALAVRLFRCRGQCVCPRRGERLLLRYFYPLALSSAPGGGWGSGRKRGTQSCAGALVAVTSCTPPCPAWEVPNHALLSQLTQSSEKLGWGDLGPCPTGAGCDPCVTPPSTSGSTDPSLLLPPASRLSLPWRGTCHTAP